MELVAAGPRWHDRLAVAAGRKDHDAREQRGGAGIDAPTVPVGRHAMHVCAQAYVQSEGRRVVLKVSRKLILRDVLRVSTGDREMREPRERSDGVQTQPLVPARPRAADPVVLLERYCLVPDMLQCARC